MAANINPIYVLTPNTSFTASITSANTAMDGTGSVNAVFTAGANGSYVQRIRIKAQGTNVATVVRIFGNNGSTQGTATNNFLIGEISIPATTASNSTANPDFEYPLNLLLKASYVLYVCIGTAVSAGVIISAIGGDF